jgi:hypothetical protein
MSSTRFRVVMTLPVQPSTPFRRLFRADELEAFGRSRAMNSPGRRRHIIVRESSPRIGTRS